MSASAPFIPTHIETVAELRDLYRAAEARAARLRLLSETGQELAAAQGDDIGRTLQEGARRLAHFLGFPNGFLLFEADGQGIAIKAPGETDRQIAVLVIPGLIDLADVRDADDRATAYMLVQLLASAIDRLQRDAERSVLLATLQEREHRLEQLVCRLFSAQEEERRRVSRELHDGVAQRATALFRMLDAHGQIETLDQKHATRRLAAIARDLVQELREVIAGLRPTILDDLGLEHAVRALVAELREAGHEVRETLDASSSRRSLALETALYRVAQEAITNITKHAGKGCLVEVTLRAQDNGSAWTLTIRDFGAGMPQDTNGITPAKPVSRFGIDIMRERMAAIGGQLVWETPEDGGVRVTASAEWHG